MSEPWELTDEEIKHYTGRFLTYRDECQCDGCKGIRNLRPAVIQKYRNWLVSQCGPEPCGEICGKEEPCDEQGHCADYWNFLGTLAGYAKAMQEMDAKLEEERAKAEPISGWTAIEWIPDGQRGDLPYKINRLGQRSGPDKYAVRQGLNCLSRDKEWEYEPIPSSRDDAFLARCRFDSFDEAVEAFEGLKRGV